jgi:hypothetical protein
VLKVANRWTIQWQYDALRSTQNGTSTCRYFMCELNMTGLLTAMHTNAAEQTVNPIWHKPCMKSGYILQIRVFYWPWTEDLGGIHRGEKSERGFTEICLKIIRESTHINISLPKSNSYVWRRNLYPQERCVIERWAPTLMLSNKRWRSCQEVITEDIRQCP